MNNLELSIYFSGISGTPTYAVGELGAKVKHYYEGEDFPEISKKSIVIFSCLEYRNSSYSSVVLKEDVRNILYRLSNPKDWSFEIFDLGSINLGSSITDTYFAVKTVVSELVKNECIPIVIGGSQDLTYAIYEGYQALEQTVNIVNIDSHLDLGSPEEPLNNDNYISHILTSRPCTLFNYSIVGTQRPFLKDADIDLIEKLYFDQCRLGDLERDFKIAEPLIRNSDILSFDLKSIKSINGASGFYPNPNGLKPEIACQISRYAGLSDRLSCFSILNYINLDDTDWYNQLTAQMIWYFIDGVAGRYNDFPIVSLNEYSKFVVKLIEPDEDIIFYKSNKSDRWWMEVPYPEDKNSNYKRQTVVPCNYEDYLQAMKNDTPDLWWKTFQKLL